MTVNLFYVFRYKFTVYISSFYILVCQCCVDVWVYCFRIPDFLWTNCCPDVKIKQLLNDFISVKRLEWATFDVISLCNVLSRGCNYVSKLTKLTYNIEFFFQIHRHFNIMLDNKCFICDSIALRASNLVVVLRGIFEIIFVCMMPSKININFNHVHERRFFARISYRLLHFWKHLIHCQTC